MSQRKRRPMSLVKVREILRLRAEGLNVSQVSTSCNCARGTVRSYWRSADECGVTVENLAEYSEDELMRLFNRKGCGRRQKQSDDDLNFAEIARMLSKKGMTLQLLWEDFRANNLHGISYSNYCLRYREWHKQQKVTYRQYHKGGEKVFVDFSGLTILLDGGRKAEIFVGVLGASNLTYVEATESQEISSWLGAHMRMLEYFGGVPEILVPDNLRSGVSSACYYEPDINRSYQEFAEHYGVAIIPTRVRKPKDKAKVEEAVQHVQRRILVRINERNYKNVAEVNEAIKPLLEELNNREQQVYGVSRWQLFEEVDKGELKCLPQQRYIFGKWLIAKVNIDFHVEVERHYYSVPYTLTRCRVDVRVREKTVEIFHNNKRVATHPRKCEAGRHSTLSEHIPDRVRHLTDQTPRKFLAWAQGIGSETHAFVYELLSSKTHVIQGFRACLGLQRLEKNYGRLRLEKACKRANYYGLTTMRSVRAILENGQDKLELEPTETLKGHEFHDNIRGDSYYH